ncbi:MAG: PBSX family phage terminase large subunit [Methanosphaera sp.]|nr:PBSX family phage terminase large subunit [Methanosphaera sp.]
MQAKTNGINTTQNDTLHLGAFSLKAQSFLYESDAFINIAHGSVRSGKTIVATFRFLLFVLDSPYYEFMISGKTRDTIEHNVIRDLIRMIDGRIPYKYRKFDNYIEIAGNKIWLIGFSDEGATEKVRGMTVGGWYADELTSASKSTVEMAITRCSVDGAQMFWTMNPESPYHFIYTDYITNQELLDSETVKCWHFTLEDNLHLSKRYIEELKRVNRKSQVNYKRNILGQWVIAEGVIYDSFDENIHVFHDDLTSQFDEVNICCDYGVSTVTTFGVMGIVKDTKHGNKYYLQEETYYDATQRGVAQSDSDRVNDILRLQDKYHLDRKSTLFLPHDAASLKAQCRKDKRIRMKVRTYAPDTYKDINRIQDLFNTERFFIHESCKNSITQAQTYCWDTRAQQRGEDKPLKVDDHCPDMWRGGLFGSRLSRNGRKINA